jgi:hypothetical protein
MWFNPSDFKKSTEDPMAISAIPAIDETQNSKTAKIATPSFVIPEIEHSRIAGIASQSESTNAAISMIVSPPVGKILPMPDKDDRHHCRECRHLSSAGYCIQQRWRPVDDLPRRCEDFSAMRSVTDQRASETRQSSEASHNAKGTYFKYLVTRQDGSQFYSCSMPRKTWAEVREQFPDATMIEPVTGEDYDDG